jgi:formylglycine-generating enzyme required for sulfatase activity
MKLPDVYPWGKGWPPPPGAGNYADTAHGARRRGVQIIAGYSDGFVTTAPVMRSSANAFGLFDLGGNVQEWCFDVPAAPQTDRRVLRGEAWPEADPQALLASSRNLTTQDQRDNQHGFRIIVELPESAPGKLPATASPSSPSASLPVSSSPASATEDAPFINRLGMKFVPVPITGPARSASPSDAGGGPTDKQRVLFSIWETRVQDYEVFVQETKARVRKPPFVQGPTHPAVGMNWNEAKAFCAWLTERERNAGHLTANEVYRLPSDHEWSCAVGIGDREDPAQLPGEKKGKIEFLYPWGTSWPPPARTGNLAGIELATALASGIGASVPVPIPNYQDEFVTTAPVGSFAANPLGLFDLEGNVFEWCEDKFEASPKDDGVMRGGGWASGAEGRLYLSSYRRIYPRKIEFHFYNGFRVVLAPVTAPSTSATAPVSPSPSLPVSSSSASAATKDAPFTNTLGMKFVPVPITGPARSASPSDAGGGPTDKQRVLFSIWETRVQDYEAFVKETTCKAPQPRFQSEFVSGAMHPVSAINWDDATAFCAWLTERERKTGKIAAADVYRLPSDHEWSCAVGLGSREDASLPPSRKNRQIPDVFPWGTEWPPPQGVENLAGEELRPLLAGGLHPYIKDVISGYRDDFTELAPVGSFKANALGLHDLGGNVAEWCEDWLDASKKVRVLRGATWLDHVRQYSFSSMRPSSHPTDSHFSNYGFRVVLAPVAANKGPKDEANR